MMARLASDPRSAIGRSPEQLSIEERFNLAGNFIALELYTPKTLPLRRIEAIGRSTTECIRQLESRGLNPSNFEFVLLTPAY